MITTYMHPYFMGYMQFSLDIHSIKYPNAGQRSANAGQSRSGPIFLANRLENLKKETYCLGETCSTAKQPESQMSRTQNKGGQ